jgi:hypothetical protein
MVDLQATGSGASTAKKSWLPTRKWWAATVVALGAIATLWVTNGAFDRDVAIAAIAAVVQAATSYLVPNQDTPGGVPIRT